MSAELKPPRLKMESWASPDQSSVCRITELFEAILLKRNVNVIVIAI